MDKLIIKLYCIYMEKLKKLIKIYLKIDKIPRNFLIILACCLLGVILMLILFIFRYQNEQKVLSLEMQKQKEQIASISGQLRILQNQDQYKINQDLAGKIKTVETSYKKVISDYEGLTDIKLSIKDTKDMDSLFTQSLSYISNMNYASAEASLDKLSSVISIEQQKLAAASVSTNVAAVASNNPPDSGFSQQNVTTDRGNFTVDIIAGNLSSTKVIVDTASDSDCSNNCPVLSLADYVSRNGAFAGINGTFFCPADYPSCNGKSGSFDTLLMNSKKHYFNSDNNVYSTVPAVIVGDSYIRFVSQSLQWGRDTSPNAVIAMQPMLVFNNQIAFNGSDDPKFGSKGTRSFIANKDNMVYIGTIFNATMEDSAHVLQTLHMQNAINLDEGGSTALWFGGYKAGPGRNIPNAVLFLRK